MVKRGSPRPAPIRQAAHHQLDTFDRDAVATFNATLNRAAGTIPHDEVAASQNRFAALAATLPVQTRTRAKLDLGFQTHGPVELGTGELSGFGTRPPPSHRRQLGLSNSAVD